MIVQSSEGQVRGIASLLEESVWEGGERPGFLERRRGSTGRKPWGENMLIAQSRNEGRTSSLEWGGEKGRGETRETGG